jgi:hypothetical protein
MPSNQSATVPVTALTIIGCVLVALFRRLSRMPPRQVSFGPVPARGIVTIPRPEVPHERPLPARGRVHRSRVRR